jgi:hypothetical protein
VRPAGGVRGARASAANLVFSIVYSRSAINSRKGVTDSEFGEMDINLSGVNCLSSELRQHLLGGDTSVVEFRAFLQVDSVHLPSNSLEHGGTTTRVVSGWDDLLNGRLTIQEDLGRQAFLQIQGHHRCRSEFEPCASCRRSCPG